jgi:zinc protease
MIGVMIGLVALCQPAASAAVDAEPGPRFERLENGLRIGVVEEHALPLISVQLWYEAGSASDKPGAEGLCNVTRTVLERRDGPPQRLSAAGVRFESRTLMDACYFASVLRPDSLDDVLGVEARRMRPLAATAAEVAAALAAAIKEDESPARDVVREEDRRLLAAMFAGHPYQNPPDFISPRLQGLTPEQANEFARRWFVPGNALVLVVGDVDPEATLGRMRELFGTLEWRQPPRLRGAALPQEATTAPAEPSASVSSAVTIAWLTPPARDIENAAIDVLMHRLCNPVDGPLALRLDKLGCAAPHWRHEQWRQGGMLVLEVAGSEQARSAVSEEIERAASSVPSEIEFNRARALASRDRLRADADFQDRALRLGWWDMMAGDPLMADFEHAAVERLPIGLMQQAAAELLRARRVCVGSSKLPHNVPPGKTPGNAGGPGGCDIGLSSGLEAVASAEVVELRPGLCLRVYRVPGAEQVEVETIITSGLNDARPLTVLMAVGSMRHTVDQVRDYLTYRASEMCPSGPPHLGLIGRGPAGRAAQLVELEAELIRFPQTSHAACARAAELRQAGEDLLKAAARRGEMQVYVPRGFIGLDCSASEYPENTDEVAAALGELGKVDGVEIIITGDPPREELLNAVRAAWPASGKR